MKLLVTCPSGLHIEFEGNYAELPHLDRFLEEIARVEAERLELRHQLDIAEHRIPVTFEWEPVSPPSPPMAPGLAAEPDGGDRRPDTPAAGTAGESSRPPARTSPRAGGTGRPGPHPGSPGYGQAATLALDVIKRLGECSKQQIIDETGSGRSPLTKVLRELRDQGAIVATGATTDRRYRLAGDDNGGLAGEHDDEAFVALTPVPVPAEGAGAPAPLPETDPPVVRRQQAPHEGRVIGVEARARMDAEREERNALGRERILALVAEHGPVSYSWVADQLVKNRRDTAALMRDMTLAGELVETDDGGYYDIPGRDDQEAQAA